MEVSPQRECSSEETLCFLLNFFTKFAMAVNRLIIEGRRN